MKTLVIFFIIVISTVSIFAQSKSIQTGLYLISPKDSCIGKTNYHMIVYSSDTLCLAQKPVFKVKDIAFCDTATANLDGHELYVLNIALKDSAKLKLKEITEANVGKKMAMVIGGEVVMSAVIKDPVTTGRMTISGEKKQKIKEWAEKIWHAMKKK